MKYFRLLMIFPLIFLATACSSTKENAFKLLQSEQYESAMNAFEIVLRSSPLDAEAQAGLKKSREGVISAQLLKVRSYRLGDNSSQATALLESTLLKQKEWDVAPEGAVSSTMFEEIGYALSFIKKELMEALREKKPLKGKLIEKSYASILRAAGSQRSIANLDEDLKKIGVKNCADFEAEAKRERLYYFGRWTLRYCGYWGKGIRNPVSAQPSNPSTRHSFGKISMKAAVQGSPAEFAESLESSVKSALESSPWFVRELKSESAALEGSGTFSNQYKDWPEILTHSYTVSVPYTDYEDQPRTVSRRRLMCITESGEQEEITSGLCRGRTPFAANVEETIWEKVPVTKMRDEPRTYRFKGMAYDHQMDLSMNLRIKFNSLDFSIPVENQYKQSGTYHHESLPDIGLKPAPLDTATPIQWLGAQRENLVAKLSGSLHDRWLETYCGNNAPDGMQSASERTHACLAGKPAPVPQFVDDWFTNRLGLSEAEARKALE